MRQKVIDGRDGETTILSGVLGDESGRLPFTDWDPHDEIEEGASVRLDETFVREFRGAPSVNVSEFSAVTALDRTVGVTEDAPRLSVREAVESGGLFDVELAGNVIEVRDGSGLIERCPECGRVIQNGQCRSHGAVEGEDDLRTKAILDDGTDTVTAVLDDELTARVYGGDLDDAREHARDAMDKEVVAERISDRIVGREYVVRGSLSVDEYGANLTASTFAEADDDPATRAQALLRRQTHERIRDSGPGRREVAHRLFAAEFDDADLSYSESDEERAPNYVVTPTGARVNRLFLVGALTELEQVNDDVLRARVVDPTGPFVSYAGQYQPDELAFLEAADPPMFVAVTGKARTFQPDDSDRVFTSVRPESISEVDADTRDRWVVQAAEQTVSRIGQMASAKQAG